MKSDDQMKSDIFFLWHTHFAHCVVYHRNLFYTNKTALAPQDAEILDKLFQVERGGWLCSTRCSPLTELLLAQVNLHLSLIIHSSSLNSTRICVTVLRKFNIFNYSV